MISVIIPFFNEEGVIGKTVEFLTSVPDKNLITEIIAVDGGSSDNSVNEARQAGAYVITAPAKGRAIQMNIGAKIAKGKILYFLHADSLPPPSFASDIRNEVGRGYSLGCYRLRFDMDHWFLKANAWFTRFDVNAFRYGDQSLFVLSDLFRSCGGFREDHIFMEDQEIIQRLRKNGKFVVMPREVITSARKYKDNGVYRMQYIFFRIYFMYKLGFSQEALLKVFRNMVKQTKI